MRDWKWSPEPLCFFPLGYQQHTTLYPHRTTWQGMLWLLLLSDNFLNLTTVLVSKPVPHLQISESPSEIMESLTKMYSIPKDKQVCWRKRLSSGRIAQYEASDLTQRKMDQVAWEIVPSLKYCIKTLRNRIISNWERGWERFGIPSFSFYCVLKSLTVYCMHAQNVVNYYFFSRHLLIM